MKINKNFFRILELLILINIIIFSCVPVNAVLTPKQLDGELNNVGEVKPMLASVLEVTAIIASAISIIIIIVLGIKYMVGSTEERAEYKKTLLPYVIGAVFVFGATTVASVVYNMIKK